MGALQQALEKSTGADKSTAPEWAIQSVISYFASSARSVDKPAIACIDTDVANLFAIKPEENQIAGRKTIEADGTCVTVLIDSRSRHIDADLLISKINKTTAVKSMGRFTAERIGRADVSFRLI